MGEIASLEVEVEQGGANIEAGDTCAGVITGSEVKEFTHDGDDVTYYGLMIEEDESGIEFTPDWPARITPGTGFGRLIQRFGVELSIGDRVDPADVFEPGQRVEFEVDEEQGDDPDQTFLVADKETVRPEGDELSEADAEAAEGIDTDESESGDEDGSGGDGTIEDEVLEIIADMDSDDDADVKKALAQESGDHLKAFKGMVGDSVEIEDGSVSLA